MLHHPLPRLDQHAELRQQLLPYCRLKPGDVWRGRQHGHRVGCLDAARLGEVKKPCGKRRAVLTIHDLPYNFIAFAHSGTTRLAYEMTGCRCLTMELDPI